MSDKVMWLEGMVLSPHHFQQAEKLLNQDQNARFKLVEPFHYGLASMDIDREALQSGHFTLRECSGVFPDGTSFSFPSLDGSLDHRAFHANFAAGQDSLGVYLAAPSLTPGSPNFANATSNESKPARFIGQSQEAQDLNTGGTTRTVILGRLNLRIVFEGESTSGLQTIKLCELRRNAQSQVQTADDFFASCLRLSASEVLMTRLKKFTENAQQKSSYLMAQRAQKSTGVAQFSAESLTQYLLLSAINMSLPELLHFLQQPSAHPEALYRRLIAMTGSLLSFGSDNKISDMPPYMHGDLKSTFKPLFELLDILLGTTVPTGYRMIPLTKTSPIQYLANLREVDLTKIRELYLGVGAQASEVEIITAVQRKAKMGPATKLETLITHALPGLSLLPESLPPSGIPAKAGFKYFRVHQTGDLWDGVQQGKSLALHMPSDLPSPKLELIATLE